MAKKQMEDLIADWSVDAEKFVREAIGHEKISKQQKKFLQELSFLVNAKIRVASDRENASAKELEYAKKKGITIMAGQGVGKDTSAAWAILWFLCCFPYPKIPCTAPTAHQLKDVLWAEISKWIRHSSKNGNPLIDDIITWNAEKCYMNQAKKPGSEWFAVARTCNTKASAEEQAETLAGFHEDFQMIVADEASAIPDPVFKPIEGTLTGICNFALVIFNPTRSTGFALKTHHGDRRDWVCLQWNAEESEIVTQDHIEYMRRKYGKESNVYRIRVLGLPPKSDDDALIKWDWIQDSIEREFADDPGYVTKIGVDIGGGGDKSIVLERKGYRVVPPILESRNDDTMAITGWVAEHIRDLDENDNSFIDIVGIGRGPYDRLRELGLRIMGVNVSNSAVHPERFSRLRDELWWRMRDAFERGEISIPNDEELIGELSCIKYATDSNGKIKVESKKDLRKRNLPSPNKADALCLTYYFEDTLNRTKAMEEKWFDKYDAENTVMNRDRSWMSA